MSVCWYCHWGWSKPVHDIYEKYLALVGEGSLDYGPGHIVWSDENFETEDIQWCIDHAHDKLYADIPEQELSLVIESLKELLEVPEEIRAPEPEEYKGENPECFPPSESIIMVNKR